MISKWSHLFWVNSKWQKSMVHFLWQAIFSFRQVDKAKKGLCWYNFRHFRSKLVWQHFELWKKSIWPKKVLCPYVLFMNFSTSMHSTYSAIPNPILNSLLKITNCVRRENCSSKPLWFLYPKPWSICQKSSGFLYDSLFIVFYNFRKSPRTFLLPLDEGRL